MTPCRKEKAKDSKRGSFSGASVRRPGFWYSRCTEWIKPRIGTGELEFAAR